MVLILVIIALCGFGASYFFYTKSQQLVAERDRLEVLLQQSNSEREKALMDHSQSIREVEMLREQQEYERRKKAEDELQLKEQLKAIAKDVVQEGNSAIKLENKTQLEQILQPFKEKLNTFEQEVRANKEKGVQQHASMESLVKALSEQHDKMNNTAQNLADALRGDQKTQGNWGELALERILEMSGLHKDVEYIKQSSFRNEENSMQRPDFLIKLPDNKHIVIDAKVSLKAFERFVNAENDEHRKLALRDHLVSVNAHIKILGDKNYSALEGLQSPEFVLLFIPMEASFSLAIREEPDIYQKAWEKRIVLVTPSTLLATLKTVESIWKQERQNVNAIRIAVEAGRLYDKFAGFLEDMKRIESRQKEAMAAYDSAMNKLSTGNGNIVGKVESLKKLGAKASKQIDNSYIQPDDEN